MGQGFCKVETMCYMLWQVAQETGEGLFLAVKRWRQQPSRQLSCWSCKDLPQSRFLGFGGLCVSAFPAKAAVLKRVQRRLLTERPGRQCSKHLIIFCYWR